MKVTCSGGNSKNGIKGMRVRIYTDNGILVDEIHVNTHQGLKYFERNPNGIHAHHFRTACASAKRFEDRMMRAAGFDVL